MSSTPTSPRGIGGWLILPMLGLILTPVVLGVLLLTQYVPIFTTEQWSLLTTPGGPDYHPLWAPILLFEVLGNLFMMGYAIVLLVLMFRHHYLFPILIIAFYAINLVYGVVDLVLANQIPIVAAQDDSKIVQQLARSAFSAAIWIPYFLVSVRVKNTFVKRMSDYAGKDALDSPEVGDDNRDDSWPSSAIRR